MVVVQSFDDFYAQHRQSDEPDHSFLRSRAGVSGRQIKTQDNQYKTEVDTKYDEKAALRDEYQRQVELGLIREPTRIERALEAAKGHPDNPATQAAKRLLKKYGVSHE